MVVSRVGTFIEGAQEPCGRAAKTSQERQRQQVNIMPTEVMHW